MSNISSKGFQIPLRLTFSPCVGECIASLHGVPCEAAHENELRLSLVVTVYDHNTI